MKEDEYNKLLKTYIDSSIKICIEKKCGYKFIFTLHNECKLLDIYNYIIKQYLHISEIILLYKDNKYKNIIPYNEIKINDYIKNENIRPITLKNLPIVYKFYLNICNNKENYLEKK
jgi:hypothetical protein